MNCPDCQSPMQYMNQDYVSHGYYCPKESCGRWVQCDKDCCTIEKIDRRNPAVKPRPNMVWSERHLMWLDPDTRTPEQKVRDQQVAAAAEKRFQDLMAETQKFLDTPYEQLTPEQQKAVDQGADRLLAELRRRRSQNKRRPSEDS